MQVLRRQQVDAILVEALLRRTVSRLDDCLADLIIGNALPTSPRGDQFAREWTEEQSTRVRTLWYARLRHEDFDREHSAHARAPLEHSEDGCLIAEKKRRVLAKRLRVMESGPQHARRYS